MGRFGIFEVVSIKVVIHILKLISEWKVKNERGLYYFVAVAWRGIASEQCGRGLHFRCAWYDGIILKF
jgi:hypothetical protein